MAGDLNQAPDRRSAESVRDLSDFVGVENTSRDGVERHVLDLVPADVRGMTVRAMGHGFTPWSGRLPEPIGSGSHAAV